MKKLFYQFIKFINKNLLILNSCDFGDLILHVVKILEKNQI